VRKAICYAADRVEINAVMHRGNYSIAYWPIPQKLGVWCNPNIIKYDHDLNEARIYLDMAHFPWSTTPYTPPLDPFGITMIIVVSIIIAIVVSIVLVLHRKDKKERMKNRKKET
jgi:hypothetical protein